MLGAQQGNTWNCSLCAENPRFIDNSTTCNCTSATDRFFLDYPYIQNEWKGIRVSVGECGWVWVSVGECGWVWVSVGECGWVWVSVGECGWVWVSDCESVGAFVLTSISLPFFYIIKFRGRRRLRPFWASTCDWLPGTRLFAGTVSCALVNPQLVRLSK